MGVFLLFSYNIELFACWALVAAGFVMVFPYSTRHHVLSWLLFLEVAGLLVMVGALYTTNGGVGHLILMLLVFAVGEACIGLASLQIYSRGGPSSSIVI